MSIQEEIRQSRLSLLTKDEKDRILGCIKEQMKYKETALIYGAAHFQNQVWNFNTECQAPYKYHSALSEWLKSIGFTTRRYYNKLGVDQGLEVIL